MTDPTIRERLDVVERLRAPDVWLDATTRMPQAIVADGPAVTTRLRAAAVAFAVFAVAVFMLWQASGGDEPAIVDEPPAPTVDSFDALPQGWTDLGPMPQAPSGTTAWTGIELISWGGGGEDGPGPLRADGFRLDPLSGGVELIGEAPIEPRADPASAWTGQEFLIWGGWREGAPFFDDGAAYDPVTDSWRRLPPAPISARVPLSAWTGTEWIVWGTSVRVDDRPLDGAAYDPASDTWRSIADGPVAFTDATAMWTGEEFVVVGAALHGGNVPETPTAVAAAYDPADDGWRVLPDSPLDPNSNTAVWTGERIIGADYNHTTASYDPASGSWTELGRLPGEECEGGLSDARSASGWVFVSDCGTTSVLPPGATQWLVGERTPETYFARALTAGSSFLVVATPLDGGLPNAWSFTPYDDLSRFETRFFPSSAEDGSETVMPITFPDGATATLRFPYYYELDTFAAYPHVSWLWSEDPPPRYAIEFVHGAKASVDILVGDSPVGEIVDATGTSRELWRLRGPDDGATGIVFELPEWTVVIPTGGFEPGAVGLAFSVRQDANRLPVVTAEAPFELSKETGEGESARLTLGTLILEPGTCELRPIDRTEHQYAATCAADGRVTVSMYGVPTDYALEIVTGTDVEDFVAAG